jgi:SAM-dependent methyltransferase
MLNYALKQIDDIEKKLDPYGSRADALQLLRALGLSDFGELMISLPNPLFPKLSSILPQMASDEVQKSWTGNSGLPLLMQTLDFVRSASYNFTKISGRSLDHQRILDFGCGYGRIARLMYYFTSEDRFYGVDPWDRSIQICNDDGLTSNFYVSEYLPNKLPLPEVRFDFIFAFSVFTHLSQRATAACLKTICGYIEPDGVILITIRPIEYWDVDINAQSLGAIEQMKRSHIENGFAFLPHHRDVIDGDITYGDTSMTLDWLQKHFPELKVMGMDRSLADPYQLYVFLQKN